MSLGSFRGPQNVEGLDPMSFFGDAIAGAIGGGLGAVARDAQPLVNAAARQGAPPPPPPAPEPPPAPPPTVHLTNPRIIHFVTPKPKGWRKYAPYALVAGAGLAVGGAAIALLKR